MRTVLARSGRGALLPAGGPRATARQLLVLLHAAYDPGAPEAANDYPAATGAGSRRQT